ncbi:DsbA family protein [Mycobacterium shimoidei]|uniref:DsbA family protein n=1 Tax=Mycobacterium shimoidei TaxID=29313 RepID=UPI001E650ACC|nr:thioredoxin domain-containing protein [Mycobacterium shimoidei]
MTMRFWLGVLAALCSLLFGAGTAHADVTRTGDGNGVLVGRPDAPVQLEIFCEPQCPHCAELEAKDGDRIAGALDDGRLAVTYRWLTFLDAKHNNDASARMTNALFLAADPMTSPAAYQAFVQDLYRHRSPDGPTDDDIAAMARESGVPEWVAGRITAGDNAVDTNVVNDANRARLNAENPEKPGTPTVYDMNTEIVVDLQYSDWLDKLLG